MLRAGGVLHDLASAFRRTHRCAARAIGTIETNRGDRPTVSTFLIETLDSSPGVMGAGTRRAYWDGTKLVTEGAGIQHGYTLRGAKNCATAKDVYTRVMR